MSIGSHCLWPLPTVDEKVLISVIVVIIIIKDAAHFLQSLPLLF